MKIEIVELSDLTTFGETLIDFIPFFSIITEKNNGLSIIFGIFEWNYKITIKKK